MAQQASAAAPALAGREYVTVDEAASILEVKRQSVLQLIARQRLHAMRDPQDQRRRLLLRSEVEARARYTRQFPYGLSPDAGIGRESVPRGEGGLSDEERRLLLGLAAGALAIGSVLVLAKSNDPMIRATAVGVLAGLALLVIAEAFKSGRMDAVERTQAERRISELEAQSALLSEHVEELQSIIDRWADTALSSAS